MKKEYEAIIIRLIDAQCNPNMIQRCREHLQENGIRDCICLLSMYRKELITSMDIQCKRIDCIDHLIYKLERCRD